MKSYRKELWFNVPSRRGFVNITRDVEACLAESGITEGLCLVNAMHITASVFINDDESGLHHDYESLSHSVWDCKYSYCVINRHWVRYMSWLVKGPYGRAWRIRKVS